MAKLKKIVLKVLHEGLWQWVHLCYISDELYREFFQIVGCEKSEFGVYVSIWAQGDFGVHLSMTTYADIQTLRWHIKHKYATEYAELYALSELENPRINGWMRLWLSQHMRVAIAARKECANE